MQTDWTLGDFLATTTSQLRAALPYPGRRPQRPFNFSPRRSRSASARATSYVPPTAEHRAQVQVLRTLGIVGTNQKITAEQMKAYDGMFAAPIPLNILAAIAAMVDCQMPSSLDVSPCATVSAGCLLEV